MTHQPEIHLSRGKAACELAQELAAVAIVVDALRASATIVRLFEHGISSLLVIAQVEDARALAEDQSNCVLVGERGGLCIPGFHLGNSPLEVIASPRMEGKTAIFTSSNGAQRLAACSRAEQTVVGSLLNAGALAKWARRYAEGHARPIVFVAAGKYPDEQFISPEDEATCAYLAGRIGLPIAADSAAYFAKWQRTLILEGLENIFRASRHARRLMEIGYGDDVLHCACPGASTVIPTVVGPVMLGARQVGVELHAMPPVEETKRT